MKGNLLKIKARKSPKMPMGIKIILYSLPTLLTDFKEEFTKAVLE